MELKITQREREREEEEEEEEEMRKMRPFKSSNMIKFYHLF